MKNYHQNFPQWIRYSKKKQLKFTKRNWWLIFDFWHLKLLLNKTLLLRCNRFASSKHRSVLIKQLQSGSWNGVLFLCNFISLNSKFQTIANMKSLHLPKKVIFYQRKKSWILKGMIQPATLLRISWNVWIIRYSLIRDLFGIGNLKW